MVPARVPPPLRWLLPGAMWRMRTEERVLFLTFDDGPLPGLTPWVLDTLRAHRAKATFFMLGRNASAHPGIVQQVRDEGHGIGNHTWSHPDGWRTTTDAYLADVERARACTGSSLFRPPYGRIGARQFKALRSRYQVVMWDVLSADYDSRLSPGRCLHRVTAAARPGSIIVFHDSLKAERLLRATLPAALDRLSGMGYRFLRLPEPGPTALPK
ncbi:MAG: polysaccharide deacetylase family protein [Flavobacteriales bacterium]|nr:MAG: polysaccharide deacetylase family protein [Flavobacteriales bacterium]